MDGSLLGSNVPFVGWLGAVMWVPVYIGCLNYGSLLLLRVRLVARGFSRGSCFESHFASPSLVSSFLNSTLHSSRVRWPLCSMLRIALLVIFFLDSRLSLGAVVPVPC